MTLPKRTTRYWAMLFIVWQVGEVGGASVCLCVSECVIVNACVTCVYVCVCHYILGEQLDMLIGISR